jgi:HEPN superfamily AbiU2-like protein
MAIQISDSAEFEKLIGALARELVDANIFFRLHTDLLKAATEYTDEMNQTATFWDRTIHAHLDAAVFRLCKIFDQDTRNLSLPGLLDTVRANPHLFEPAAFEKRMEGREFAETLKADPPKLDRALLDQDIAYVTRANNAVVDRLINVRHNFYSHRNAKDVVAGQVVGEKYSLTRDDVHELLRGGMRIANHYSVAFSAQSYSTQMVGHDDYIWVLKAVRARLKARQQEFEEECRRFGVDPSQL